MDLPLRNELYLKQLATFNSCVGMGKGNKRIQEVVKLTSTRLPHDEMFGIRIVVFRLVAQNTLFQPSPTIYFTQN
jgi:hypothetical protein